MLGRVLTNPLAGSARAGRPLNTAHTTAGLTITDANDFETKLVKV